MWRWTARILNVFSLLAASGIAVLWVDGYRQANILAYTSFSATTTGTTQAVSRLVFASGKVELSRMVWDPAPDDPSDAGFLLESYSPGLAFMALLPADARKACLGWRWGHASLVSAEAALQIRVLVVPCWIVQLLTLVLPAVAALRFIKRRRQGTRGFPVTPPR